MSDDEPKPIRPSPRYHQHRLEADVAEALRARARASRRDLRWELDLVLREALGLAPAEPPRG